MPIYRLFPTQQRRKAVNKKIRSGFGGNLDTITAMRQLARSRAKEVGVRELALSIIRNIPSHNYRDEALAIGQYVQANVRYVRDIDNVEQLQDPLLMIQDLQNGRAAGDCDDMALLIATLLLSIGAQPYFRTVRYQSAGGPYNHIYVVVYENNHKSARQRVVLDAIVKDQPIGYEIPHKSGDEHRV